jgi:O-acetyl-ADP-ribose deacetylase (regulator of RNase III)
MDRAAAARAPARRPSSSVAVIDLTSDDDEAKGPRHVGLAPIGPPAKRARPSGGPAVRRLTLPEGVLDGAVLSTFEAIAQQSNCVGCDGRGLAAAIARQLPYGCAYASRRPQPPKRKFAIREDRATPGTIEVRRAPAGHAGPGRPAVVCMFAQWEMGAPGRYARVSPAPPSDAAPAREEWFGQCLEEVARLDPPIKSIAFPHQIGCGLAGGNWRAYEAMILDFADRNPHILVAICGMARGGGTGSTRSAGASAAAVGGCFRCGQSGHWANACPSREL